LQGRKQLLVQQGEKLTTIFLRLPDQGLAQCNGQILLLPVLVMLIECLLAALQLADQMGLLFGGCQPELMDEKIGFNDVGRRWQDVGHQVLGLDDAMILRATNGDLPDQHGSSMATAASRLASTSVSQIKRWRTENIR
jgi:hypothetical protein